MRKIGVWGRRPLIHSAASRMSPQPPKTSAQKASPSPSLSKVE